MCLAVALMALVGFSSCERVDAGHEGILVNLYGSDKGVNDVSLVTGMVYYNPFTQNVYEYPTFVQTVDYPAFTINAKDGSEFTVDPTISLKIIDGQAAPIFRKYRKDVPDIINGPLFNHVRDAFRIQLNKFTTDEIVSMRDSLEKARKLVVAAQAEAEANRLRTQALTPAVLQKAWIDKWDGSIPSVITGGNSQTFLDISKFK